LAEWTARSSPVPNGSSSVTPAPTPCAIASTPTWPGTWVPRWSRCCSGPDASVARRPRTDVDGRSGAGAGSYTAGSGSAGGLPTPDEVAAFLVYYDNVRTRPFAPRQQQAAAASASWVIAYNARCELSLLGGGAPTVELAHHDRHRYLALRW
jgi:hypothetical protein